MLSSQLINSTKSLVQKASQRCCVSSVATGTPNGAGTAAGGGGGVNAHRIIHAIATISWFGVATGAILTAPLDELKSYDPKNGCYHSHLHPR